MSSNIDGPSKQCALCVQGKSVSVTIPQRAYSAQKTANPTSFPSTLAFHNVTL